MEIATTKSNAGADRRNPERRRSFSDDLQDRYGHDPTRRLIAVSFSGDTAGRKPVKTSPVRLSYAFRGRNV